MSADFDTAKKAYLKKDPRKLAEFVRTNQLTPEQAEFVAMALAGDVETKDGRTEKPWTRTLLYEYSEIKLRGTLKRTLFGDKSKVSEAEIYRALAERHGYADEGAVKKAISRAIKRRDELIAQRSSEYSFDGSGADDYLDHLHMMKNEGRDFKVNIPAEVLQKWLDQNPDIVPPEGFDITDWVIDVASQIEMLETIKLGDTIKK
jgi:hypothetical protein